MMQTIEWPHDFDQQHTTGTLTNEEIQVLLASVPRWYHRIQLRPGVVTPGINDSAAVLARLNLPESCVNLRVLDLGTSDGFFAFELERRGAEVVAVDYRPRADSGFDLVARIHGYNGIYIQENIYNLDPQQLGSFDIVLCLGLLYHLPDPLGALAKVRSLCRGQLYLETYVLNSALIPANEQQATPEALVAMMSELPLMQFLPGKSLNNDPTNYWAPNMKCLEAMLTESMFEILEKQIYGDRAVIECRAIYDAELDTYTRISRGMMPGRI
jgi:tRNA (mo5U34)-methyltransferase